MRSDKTIKCERACRAELECNHKLIADRWGNYKFVTKDDVTYRIKFQKQVMRLERKFSFGWHRITSVSYRVGIAPFTAYIKAIKK